MKSTHQRAGGPCGSSLARLDSYQGQEAPAATSSQGFLSFPGGDIND